MSLKERNKLLQEGIKEAGSPQEIENIRRSIENLDKARKGTERELEICKDEANS